MGGEGFVGGEADCAFADFEAGEVGAEFVDDEVAHGEEAAVVFEGSDGDDAAVMFESGDSVADGFGGAFGAGGEDGGAYGVEGRADRFGEVGVVAGDCLFVRRTGGRIFGVGAASRLFHGSLPP